MNRILDHLRIIITDLMPLDLCSIFSNLINDHRRKCILNPSVIHLASGRHDSDFLMFIGKNLKYRFLSGHFLCTVHLLLFNDQRNHSRARDLISLFYREITMATGNHHLTKCIHCTKFFTIDLQYTVTIRDQFNLTFLHFRWMHVLTLADLPQNLCRLIFMKHTFLLFPYIQMFLTYG